MIEYDFTKGLYRAFVKTTYRNGYMQEDSVDSNKYEFESLKEEEVYTFRTNQNIKVNPRTLEPVGANLLVTDTFGNSWAKYYDNQLIVCGGTRISGDYFNIGYQREISGVTYNFKYLYIAVDDSGNTYPEYSYCNKFKEIAYFGIPNYSSVDRFLSFHGGDMSVSNSEQHRYINIGNLTKYKPQHLYRLFYYNCNLDEVENLENLDTSEITGDYAFYETFSSMLNIANAVFNKLANWVISNNITLFQAFINTAPNDKSYRISNIYAIENWNTNYITNLRGAFAGVRLTRILDLDTRNVETFDQTYLNCELLTNVDLTNYRFDNLRHISTSGSRLYADKGFGGMFRLCTGLITFTMGHEYTSNEGINFRDMFEECYNLVTANMGTVHNTSNDMPISFNNTFDTCTALRNFSVVYDGNVAFYTTFYQCTHIETIDIHPTVVSKCTSLRAIFYGCSALKEVNLNNLDLSYFTQSSSANSVFTGCNAITTIHCPYAVSSNYSIALPKTMYDSNGNSYSTLPGGNITIYATNPVRDTWQTKSWSSPYASDGDQVWTDGDNIYYSYASSQLLFDKVNKTWTRKTWSGLSRFYGRYIWTDGVNIYCSNGNQQYVLNKSNSTWSVKTWNGFNEIYGEDVWTDGVNIYYSYNDSHYVLDKTTDTWNIKTWNGLDNFSGSFMGGYVWTDGEDVYYSSVIPSQHISDQFVLDKLTDTWVQKDWGEAVIDSSTGVWSDGYNLYFSANTHQYVFNKLTKTWSAKSWNNYIPRLGENIWTDGEDIYYSSYVTGTSEQYVLV